MQPKKAKKKTLSASIQALVQGLRYIQQSGKWISRADLVKDLVMTPGMARRVLAALKAGGHVGCHRQKYSSLGSPHLRDFSTTCTDRRTTRKKNKNVGAPIEHSFAPGALEEEKNPASGHDAATGAGDPAGVYDAVAKTGSETPCHSARQGTPEAASQDPANGHDEQIISIPPFSAALGGLWNEQDISEEIPIEMRLIQCLVYHTVISMKARNAEQGRFLVERDSYTPIFKSWEELQWLLLHLVTLEPTAAKSWNAYRTTCHAKLDELVPDWRRSMKWAAIQVLGVEEVGTADDGWCADAPESTPAWVIDDRRLLAA